MQWAHTGKLAGAPEDGGAAWFPTMDGKGFQLSALSDGAIIRTIEVAAAADVNHVQLVANDSIAYVSSRLTNAIYKVDVASGANEWICGGTHGEFEIVDYDGTVYAAGQSLWHGQHNAEYFGSYYDEEGELVHELMMFDNQCVGRSSGRSAGARVGAGEEPCRPSQSQRRRVQTTTFHHPSPPSRESNRPPPTLRSARGASESGCCACAVSSPSPPVHADGRTRRRARRSDGSWRAPTELRTEHVL